MSPKQKTYYFTLWNRVMVQKNWHKLSTKERDQERYKIHAKAGCPQSSLKFTNLHFNRFKSACEALLAGKNTGGNGKVDDDDARRRLVWRIKDDARKAGLAPEYIIECARDLHVLGTCWEDLDLDSLTNLMQTIHNRAGSKLGRDTRSLQHAAPRRRHALEAVPRMFTPRRADKPTTTTPNGQTGDIVLGEFAYSPDPDNEPF